MIDQHTLILHHYDNSPYAEKVRFVMAIKQAPYVAVEQPVIMPKPELTLLTGGYRRIPVAQFGADIYLDTRLILTEIERRIPEPSLLSPSGEMFAYWSDKVAFSQAVAIIFAEIGAMVPKAFLDDRAALSGQPFDPEVMARARPHALSQLRAALSVLERALDGSRWLAGAHPGWADAHAWMILWFLRRSAAETAKALVADFPAVAGWCEACAAMGHGRMGTATREDAIEAARNDRPDPIIVADGFAGEPRAGEAVVISADDYGRDPIEGTLVRASADEFVIRRMAEGIGALDIHAPRAGFSLRPA
jgi:glutathione S-transferase